MPKVSIITTSYKHQDFIAQTIESVLAQTYTDRELLIGDDSPDDATRDIIQNYVKKYPEKIKARHHSPNKGIVDNTTFLLSQVSPVSEYIAFLEWDDLYVKNNLEQKLKIFATYPDLAIVYSDLSFIDKHNTILLESFFAYRNIIIYQNTKIPVDAFILAGAGPIASWSTGMFRKSILSQYVITSLNPENKTYSVSDYDIYFQIATTHPVYGITDPLTQYRRHSNNLSGASGGTSSDLALLIEHYYAQGKIDKNLYNKKMSRISIVYAIFDLEHQAYKKARSHRAQSVSYNAFVFPLRKGAIVWLLCLPIWRSSKIVKHFIKRG